MPVIRGVFRSSEEAFGDYSERVSAYVAKSLVASYQLFQDHFHVKPGQVYYPCCGYDVSPSKAFSASKVTYVDLDRLAVESLQAYGVDAHHASVLDFDPGSVDVLILLNPTIFPIVSFHSVTVGGYVLCNNYHETANDLQRDCRFRFLGRIHESELGIVVDSIDIGLNWIDVETDDEWRKAPSGLGVASYQDAANVVREVTGKTTNILAEYCKLLSLAKKQGSRKFGNFLGLISSFLRTSAAGTQKAMYDLHVNGKSYVLRSRLPKKKGRIDDTYIFLRVE